MTNSCCSEQQNVINPCLLCEQAFRYFSIQVWSCSRNQFTFFNKVKHNIYTQLQSVEWPGFWSHWPMFICFILPFCFLARSSNKELISLYDTVALLRKGWQQLAQQIRLKVWLDERATIETVGFRVEHCVMNVNILEFQWSHLWSFWLNVDKSSWGMLV